MVIVLRGSITEDKGLSLHALMTPAVLKSHEWHARLQLGEVVSLHDLRSASVLIALDFPIKRTRELPINNSERSLVNMQ